MNINLTSLIKGIIDIEQQARDFYAEPLDHLSQNDFIEIMILDGCFLIELFRKHFIGSCNVVPESSSDNDPIFEMDCMFAYLCRDLLLLENQLPWFVLEFLYSLTVDSSPHPCLTKLVLNFFGSLSSLACNCKFNPDYSHIGELLHILDLIRTVIVAPFKEFESISGSGSGSLTKLPHATALSNAGVEFTRGSSASSVMNIEFKDGVFTVPQLVIADLTEPMFMNLIAFEQCHHDRSHKITSYAFLMASLIASSKDMDLLCEKEIVAFWLSPEDASHFFNKIYNGTVFHKFYYRGLCDEVNKYYKVRWNKWLERLKRDYLSNPWKVTSLVAAFILLVLTLLQTTYTIRQYYSPP